jgi:hypothetical protein
MKHSSSFPEDTWEQLLKNKQNEKHKHIVLPSPLVPVTPRNDELEQCLNEKIEISNLKKEIDALKSRNAVELRTPLPNLGSENRTKPPTLKNVMAAKAKFLKSIYDGGNNNKNNKNSKKINSKRSRRIRKHKRSAARRRSNASRRRHRTRK